MLIAGAVCPHPPLLIPAALGSAASDPPAELRKVTAAAARAVAGLAAAQPEVIVVVGGGAADREYGADASGGLHAFGVGVTVGAGDAGPAAVADRGPVAAGAGRHPRTATVTAAGGVAGGVPGGGPVRRRG